MGMGTLCMSLGLLMVLTHTTFSEYVALAPANFRPGWEYRVQITVMNTEGGRSVTIRGDILTAKDAAVSSGTVEIPDGETKQLRIQVPTSLSSADGSSYKLKLEASGGLRFTNTTSIQLESQTMVTFVQTDKGIYKALDTVRFRVLTVDSELKPQKLQRTISVKNPGGSIMKQYMDDGSKVVFSDVFEVSEYPDMGEWKIEVESKKDNMKMEYPFKVEEYVLPKFEVKAELMPDYVVRDSGNGQVTVRVTATYTYGKGVQGDLKIKIGKRIISSKITKASGSADVNIDVSEEMRRGYGTIDMVVNVTDATQRTYGTTAKVQIKNRPVNLAFDTDLTYSVFHPGTPIQAVVKVTDAEGKPLPASFEGKATTLKLHMQDYSSKSNSRSETFNVGQGVTAFTWTLSNIVSSSNSLDFRAELMYNGKMYTTSHSMQRYKTVGNSTLNARWISSAQEMWKDATFVVDIYQPENFNMATLRYMVVSRGNVVMNEKITQAGQNINLQLTPALCPKANIIVYGLTKASPKAEIIADRLKVDLQGCQSKQVMTTGPVGSQRTGGIVDLNFDVSWTEKANKAAIGEHDVFIMAVDKSVTLLQEENPDLTSGKVDTALGKFRLAPEEKSGGGPIALGGRAKRSIWPGPIGNSPSSTGALFKKSGLEVMADVSMENDQQLPPPEEGIMFMMVGGAEDAGGEKEESSSANEGPRPTPGEETTVTTVRKDFPDTWIWTSQKTDASGRLAMQEKLPDSITSWVVSAFAVQDDSEIAVTAQPLELIAFNPFFLDLNLPYSIRRGEKFSLRATVFNYGDADMQVTVNMAKSDDFIIAGQNTQSISVEKGTGQSVNFVIEPTVIKTINLTVTASGATVNKAVKYSDTVIRPLIVRPEGKERMDTETMAVILTAETPSVEKEITFTYKETPVSGSQRAEVRVTGDLMGNVLSNVDKLVTLPTGCGEQNMITTIPNIYAMSYLVAVGETTSKFNRTAKKYMKKGYEKETGNYRFDNGGYSAFGKSDGNASTWLTAFVVKSFAQAKPYIPEVVENKTLSEDVSYLESMLLENGTFKEMGRVLHDDMQGGTASQDGTLSVYVTLCLLEASKRGIAVTPEKLAKAVTFVKGVAQKLKVRADERTTRSTDTFLASLTAYTLTLSTPVDQALVNDLLKIVVDSPKAPWKEPTPPDTPIAIPELRQYPRPKAGPSALETTSYCILAYTAMGQFIKAQNLTTWLQTQQNSLGGYASTQDTVMALQATSEFAAKSSAFAAQSQVTVTVLKPAGETKITINIDNTNKRLLQMVELPDETTQVKVKVDGQPNSLSLVKVNWYYYTNPDLNSTKVTVNTEAVLTHPKRHRVTTCMRLGEGFQYNNMMLMTVDPPSGFKVDDMESIIKDNQKVKRVEVMQDRVSFYFNEAEDNLCVKYNMVQDIEVENLKPGTSSVVAYYKPDEISAESKFEIRCVENCPTPTDHAAPMASMSGLLLTACICLLLSMIVAV